MSRRRWAALGVWVVWGLVLSPATADEARSLALHTFSICALDPQTGETGVAVTTRVPEVGRLCPFAKAGVGAVATQSFVEVSYGPRALELLSQGQSPAAALEQLLRDDPARETRQLGLIDAHGASAQFTGQQCLDYAGHRAGQNYVVQGNLLTGSAVIDTVADNFEGSAAAGWPLADRLIAALEAGQAVGGDKRQGLSQSAALVVADPRRVHEDGSQILVHLQIAEHAEPVAELRRQYETIYGRLGHRELRWFEGSDVAELQSALVELGYLAPAPAGNEAASFSRGIFNQATAQAVDRFRQAEGLPAPGDGFGHPPGVVDRACVKQLKAALTRQRRAAQSQPDTGQHSESPGPPSPRPASDGSAKPSSPAGANESGQHERP